MEGRMLPYGREEWRTNDLEEDWRKSDTGS